MEKELFWTEDMDRVYGWAADFANEKDFVREVKEQYKDGCVGECDVFDVIKEHCIITDDGIMSETITPLRFTDLVIGLLYHGKVKPIGEV